HPDKHFPSGAQPVDDIDLLTSLLFMAAAPERWIEPELAQPVTFERHVGAHYRKLRRQRTQAPSVIETAEAPLQFPEDLCYLRIGIAHPPRLNRTSEYSGIGKHHGCSTESFEPIVADEHIIIGEDDVFRA